ncbi:MAG TPA: hypothetical protein EYM34_09710 [Alphaproteobacteria bacterium]|nr:hypothetical protein [Alphaproteobacteria bacterium]
MHQADDTGAKNHGFRERRMECVFRVSRHQPMHQCVDTEKGVNTQLGAPADNGGAVDALGIGADLRRYIAQEIRAFRQKGEMAEAGHFALAYPRDAIEVEAAVVGLIQDAVLTCPEY